MRRLASLYVTSLLLLRCSTEAPGPRDGGSGADSAAEPRLLALEGAPSAILSPAALLPLTFRVTDQRGAPVGGALVRLSLLGVVGDGSLDTQRGTTDSSGRLHAQLRTPSAHTRFALRAQTEAARDFQLELQVGSDQVGSLRVRAVYAGARSPRTLTADLLAVGGCDAATPVVLYTARVPSTSGQVTFTGLVAGDSFDVRGRSLGTGDALVARGCVRTPVVTPNQEAALELPLADLPLSFQGRYQLVLRADLGATTRDWASQWTSAARRTLGAATEESAFLLEALARSVEALDGSAGRQAFSNALAGPVGAQARTLLGAGTPAVSALGTVSTQLESAVRNPTLTLLWTVRSSSSETVAQGVTSQVTIDPTTPELASDDVTIPLGTSGVLECGAGASDRIALRTAGLRFPMPTLLDAAQAALASRIGVTSLAEVANLAVPCAALATLLSSSGGSCGEACLRSSCVAAVASLAEAWRGSVSGTGLDRSSVNLAFTGIGIAQSGTSLVATARAQQFQGQFSDRGGEAVGGTFALSRAP